MSRKSDRQLPKPGMPAITATYATQFQFNIDGPVTTIVFGQNGAWHTGIAVPTNLALDLCNKLQEVVTDMVRPRPDAEEPKP